MRGIQFRVTFAAALATAALIGAHPLDFARGALSHVEGQNGPPLMGQEMAGTARGTITFRVNAPSAQLVAVRVDTMPAATAQPLVRDDKGVWTGELGPLTPDIYEAAVHIDGVTRPVGSVTVPGNPPEVWEPRTVPHGEVHQISYDSPTLRMLRAVWIYTPPGYERGGGQFPVLYLLHGSGGTEASWVMGGNAHIILDNLIADRRARPMIVVMPFGHTEPSPRAGFTPTFTARDNAAFARELTDHLMPMVEKRYRTERGPEGRAIAGLSMGGGQARMIGLSRPDLFRWVGTFSASGLSAARGAPTPAAIETMLGDLLIDSAESNANLKLFWIAVGDGETGMLAQHKVLTDVLRSHSIRHTFVTIPGGHTWHVWRRNLRDFAPLLFQK